MRLYLASTSPARLATLRAAGIEPVTYSPGVDEDAVVAAAGLLAVGSPLMEINAQHHTPQQLDDVKESRRELMRVIRAVDREIVSVFQTAFEDVSEHFSALFATLFPGGAGRGRGGLLVHGVSFRP